MKTIILLVGLLAALPCRAGGEREAMPDFTLPSLAGGTVSLSDYLGDWVVVNFWATWCAPCRKEIPELSELHEQRRDIVVLGIAYEDTEISVFRTFLQEYDPAYPILLPDVYDMPAALGIPKVLPTTILVDPEGFKVRTFLGPVTRDDLEDAVAGQAPAGTHP